MNWDEETQTITITKQFVSTTGLVTEPPTGGKALVVYYSASGNTENVAKYIAKAANADIFELEPAEPYTSADLNYSNSSSRVVYEHEHPEAQDTKLVSRTVPNWDSYDTVFIGNPNWWGDMPMILYTFLESYDLSGKTVIPFNTHGGSGFSDTIDTIRALQPDAEVMDGLSISRNRIQDAEQEIIDWVSGLEE